MGDNEDATAVPIPTTSQLSSLPPSPIETHQCDPLPVGTSRIRTATPLPDSNSLIAVTESNDIIIGDTKITAPAAVRSISTARYKTVLDGGLPTYYSVVIALLEGVGLVLYSLPSLERIEGPLDEALTAATKNARLFAVNQLGLNSITDTFRVAFSVDGQVSLLLINLPKSTVEVLSDTAVSEPIVSLAFADMTVVATTVRNHCMLRIARSSNMAMAAAVLRYDPNFRRRRKGSNEPGTAVMSFFGGFFGRKGAPNTGNNQLAFPLPDNRWILSVDDEWVTYSSFGAKLEDMENVFKSRSAIDISEEDMNAALSVLGSSPARGTGALSPSASIASARPLRRSNSISSMASATSVASAFTVLTLVDEAKASRSEKPAAVAAFSSPFVLCVTDKNELLAFAANGSIPGAIASTSLSEKEGDNPSPPEQGAAIVPCVKGLCLALVYWPSGRVVEIRLVNALDSLIEERIADEELRHALALVPIERVDQTIDLRRQLAKQARKDDWHDAAVHHMQHVVNLCVSRDGFGQIDLLTEAVELRGRRGTTWEADEITATLWADFLFRLRRRVMQPSSVDIDILQTLCRADVSSTRIKALFAVRHSVPMEMGEAAITAGDCALNEDDRIEALVALYSSLTQHDKALVLLENSGVNRAYQRVCSFLGKIIRPQENPKLFFKHLNWIASEVGTSKEREDEFMKLLKMSVDVTKKEECTEELQEEIIGNCMAIVVEHNPLLLDDLIREISPDTVKRVKFAEDEQNEDTKQSDEEKKTETSANKPDEKDVAAEEGLPEGEKISTDLFAIGLLAGIARADLLQNEEVFEKLRGILGSQVLHNENSAYNPDKLIVALQSGQNKNLHEELAFLLGRQGRHEAAAVELAAERSLSIEEAKRRLKNLLPASERSRVGTTLVSAYLQVNRADAAADVIRNGGGYIDVDKIDIDTANESKTLAEMKPFLMAVLISGKERQKLSEIIRAMRVSEKRRIEEDVLMKRRRCVIIGDERACSICTRRIDDSSVFAAYPDETVTHLACHNVALSSNRSQTSVRSTRTE